MAKGIIAIDYSGTLIKADVAEQANRLRYELLGLALPDAIQEKSMHANKSHYDVIRAELEKQYGITDDMSIPIVTYDGETRVVSGKDYKTLIMTDLFRDAMLAVARKRKLDMFPDDLLDMLQRIQQRDYALAIVSGVRTDIIGSMLLVAGCPVQFDYIVGQDPMLRSTNEMLFAELRQKCPILYVIGDKKADLTPAKKLKAQSIFVTWGHPTGGEEKIANHSISDPKELDSIIK